jgi:hypothetical protein
MADGPLGQLFWRALHWLDYWLMQARLWMVDAVCGPFPDGDTPRLIGVGSCAAVAGWGVKNRDRTLS